MSRAFPMLLWTSNAVLSLLYWTTPMKFPARSSAREPTSNSVSNGGSTLRGGSTVTCHPEREPRSFLRRTSAHSLEEVLYFLPCRAIIEH